MTARRGAAANDEEGNGTMVRSLIATLALAAVGAAVVAPDTVDRAFADLTGSAHGAARVSAAPPATGTPAAAGVTADRRDHRSPTGTDAAATAPAGAYGTRRGADHYRLLTDARWDTCAVTIRYNPRSAPSGAVEELRLAAEKVGQVTGVRFTLQPTGADGDGGTGNEAGTVLVTWGGPGDGILGHDGASATAEPHLDGTGDRYVSGQVTINVANDDLYPRRFGAPGSRVALYMHELGHVMGLDHVQDPRQLMYATVAGVRDFGAGDLAGLRAASSCS